MIIIMVMIKITTVVRQMSITMMSKSLSPIISKNFESFMLDKFAVYFDTDPLQFGSRKMSVVIMPYLL